MEASCIHLQASGYRESFFKHEQSTYFQKFLGILRFARMSEASTPTAKIMLILTLAIQLLSSFTFVFSESFALLGCPRLPRQPLR